MDITYRKPTAKDLPRVAEIYNNAILYTTATFDTEPKPPSHFQPYVPGNHSFRMLVAEIDNEVVAYAGTYPFSERPAYDECVDILLYVHPEWQGRGLGGRLLAEIHKGGFMKGIHTAVSLMNKSNKPAQALFEKMGYVYKGELTDAGLKFGERHSVVFYQKML